MRSLPSNIINEKNRLSTTSSFIWLTEITLLDDAGTVLKLAANQEDVIVGATTYTAFPFIFGPQKSNSDGQLTTVTLSVSNITREIQVYLDLLDGGIGSSVKMILVNTELLTEDYTELEMDFTITGTQSDENFAVFTLGSPNLLRQRFPLNRYLSDSCRWVFREIECGYSDALLTCGRTFDQCEERVNTPRYGGFPGLRNDSVKLA